MTQSTRTRPGRTTRIWGALGAALLALGAGTAAGLFACGGPAGLTKAAVSEDAAEARAAVAALRERGPAGLRWLMQAYAADVARHTRGGPPPAGVAPADDAARWKRLSAAVDAVAAQKDAAACGLYWYTDFEQAKVEARRQGKPILSLRLLGTLDTEFSCANSRFFRTVLYANDEIGKALRDRFVLHWKSVRPVPKVTIDMGDGRTICRTITGNSIHYVLDCDGRTVDALPGLYGPRAFLRGLGAAEKACRTVSSLKNDAEKADYLARWHGERLALIEDAWAQDVIVTTAPGVARNATARDSVAGYYGARYGGVSKSSSTQPLAAGGYVNALRAMPLATSKARVESDIVRALAPSFAALQSATDDVAWARIAGLPPHREDALLDDGARAMVRSKRPRAVAPAADAARLAIGKRLVEDPLVRVVANFERSIAEDTVRNEYGFHRRIHEWFVSRLPEAVEVDAAGPDRLNEKVYAELFLTPSSDPWLGLVPDDAYSALEKDGRENAE